MNDQHSTHDSANGALERFARDAFAEEIGRTDAAARARLAASRKLALDALSTRDARLRSPDRTFRGAPVWAAAGIAAAVVAALVIGLRPGAQRTASDSDSGLVADMAASRTRGADDLELPAAADALAWPTDLVLVASDDPDVLDVLADDLEFYAWLENQPELASIGDGR